MAGCAVYNPEADNAFHPDNAGYLFDMAITQNQSGVGTASDAIESIPVPTLKPKQITYTDAEGNAAHYQGHSGDVSELFSNGLVLNNTVDGEGEWGGFGGGVLSVFGLSKFLSSAMKCTG